MTTPRLGLDEEDEEGKVVYEARGGAERRRRGSRYACGRSARVLVTGIGAPFLVLVFFIGACLFYQSDRGFKS